jgi:hypothetical protein
LWGERIKGFALVLTGACDDCIEPALDDFMELCTRITHGYKRRRAGVMDDLMGQAIEPLPFSDDFTDGDCFGYDVECWFTA